MEQRNRLLSIICVILAAACVVLAGKSCTEDNKNTGNKSTGNKITRQQYAIESGHGAVTQNVYDTPKQTAAPQIQGTTSIDVFGNVIYDVTTEAVTDAGAVNGTGTENGVTTAYNDLGTTAAEVPADTATTTALPPGFGGFHDENGSDTSVVTTGAGEEATLPADFKIIIR